MDRLEFLEMCKMVSLLPGGILDIKDTPKELRVTYDGMTFYPIAYKLSFDNNGNTVHTAILHDLKANSIINCDLLKVKRMCDK